jgi:hypothetical protein
MHTGDSFAIANKIIAIHSWTCCFFYLTTAKLEDIDSTPAKKKNDDRAKSLFSKCKSREVGGNNFPDMPEAFANFGSHPPVLDA